MRYSKRRYSKKRTYKKRYQSVAKKAIKAAKKARFARAVKKVLSKQSETKEAYFASSPDSMTTFNSQITQVGDMLQVIPNISKGVNENNRIGDQIMAQSLNVRGHIRYTPSTSVNDPGRGNIAARMMIVTLKVRPSYPEAAGSSPFLGQLLKKGGTTTTFSGILSDLYAPINTDLFTVHADKRFYLTQPMMIQPAGGGLSSGFQDLQNIVKFFNFNVKLKKKFLYDDSVNGGLTPTNVGPFMLLGYTYLNGAAPDVANQLVGLEYVSTFKFEDN
jgi:hypothetical protein